MLLSENRSDHSNENESSAGHSMIKLLTQIGSPKESASIMTSQFDLSAIHNELRSKKRQVSKTARNNGEMQWPLGKKW